MRTPIRSSLAWDTGPTPGMTPTGIGPSNATSVPGVTTVEPSGLPSSLPILAMNFELATPTDAVRPPVRSDTSALSSATRVPSSAAPKPTGRVAARKSTNASSSDNGSTRGESSRSSPMTWALAIR